MSVGYFAHVINAKAHGNMGEGGKHQYLKMCFVYLNGSCKYGKMMRRLNKMALALIVSFVFTTCNEEDDFYRVHMKSYTYVIPLIKPYRLHSDSKDSIGLILGDTSELLSWNLDFLYNNTNSTGAKDLNVTDINVDNKIIYGNGNRTKYSPNCWFVIIPGKKIEKTFKDEKEFASYMKTKGIDSVKLYSVWTIFEEFTKHSTLPWHKL